MRGAGKRLAEAVRNKTYREEVGGCCREVARVGQSLVKAWGGGEVQGRGWWRQHRGEGQG